VSALLHVAGDFSRAAYRDEADLASYVVLNGQKVLANHSVVALQKALDGDKSADVVLKPGDVVSIQQLAGWQDIGASVTIKGEVEHAGSYGIVPGERLSSVLSVPAGSGMLRIRPPPSCCGSRLTTWRASTSGDDSPG